MMKRSQVQLPSPNNRLIHMCSVLLPFMAFCEPSGKVLGLKMALQGKLRCPVPLSPEQPALFLRKREEGEQPFRTERPFQVTQAYRALQKG